MIAAPTLFSLSAPLFVQSLVTFAVLVIDMKIWSAHGPDTVAALSVAGQVFRIVMELSSVLGIGAVILISQHLGRGDQAAARHVGAVACMANGLIGIVAGIGLALVTAPVMAAMAPDGAIAEAGRAYLYLVAVATAALCFGVAAVHCLRGFGQSRIVMVLGGGGALIYLALEYLLVLRADLGAAGAGASVLIMRCLVALVLAGSVIRLLGLKLGLSAARDWALVRRMAGLALPSVSDFIAYGIYQIVLIGIIAAQGEIPLLARAYTMIAMAFLTLVIMAIVQGTEVLIGYRIGAENHGAARHQARVSALIAAGLSGGCALVIYSVADPFTMLFTDDPAVVALTRRLLFLTIFLQPCFAVNMVLFHALRAIEDVRWPVLVSQCLSWGLGLPLAWVLCGPFGFGVIGVWYAFLAEESAKALAMACRWSQRQAAW